MKICVIGNSHSNCLRQAWHKMNATHSDVSLTFFSYVGSFFDRFEVDKENGVLTISGPWVRQKLAESSGGDGDINFKDYDVCLVAGGFTHNHVMQLGQLGGASQKGYSQQAINAAIEDLYVSAHISVLIPKIRVLSDIPIYLLHDPMMAHKKGTVPKHLAGVSGVFDYEKGMDLLNAHTRFGNGPFSLPQPAETMALPGVTKYEHSIGQRKPFASEIEAGYVGELKEDRAHMKSPFGRLRLMMLFDHLNVAGLAP